MNLAAGGRKLELHAWYTKQRWRELEGEIDRSTVLVGQSTIPLLKILFIVVKYNKVYHLHRFKSTVQWY